MASLSLVFDLIGRDVSASRAFRDVGDESERTSKRVGGFGGAIGGAMKVAAGAIAGLGIASFGKDLINLASTAQQSMGGVEAVFKGYASTVKATADKADTALGLSANSYRELATVIGSQLKNAGVPMEELGGKTDALITQGADLAAMFGGTTQEAVNALSSALKGEMDPIERYGISLNDAALKAEALALGVYGGVGPLDANAKSMAVMSLVTKQGADAQGAFARESDTAAGRAARASAQWENLKTTIGDKLLPLWSTMMEFIGTKVIPGLETLGGWLVDKIGPAFTVVKDTIVQVYDILAKGDFTGGPFAEDSKFVDVLFRIRDGFIAVKDMAVQAFNILFKGDFTGGPLQEDSFVVNALFKIREGAQWLADTFQDRVLPAVRDAFAWLRDNAQPILEKVGEFLLQTFTPAWDALVDVYNNSVKPAIKDLIPVFGDVIRVVGEVAAVLGFLVAKFIEHVLPILIRVVGYVIDHMVPRFKWLGETIVWVWDSVLKPTFKALADFVSWVWNSVLKPTWDALSKAWSAVGSGISAVYNNVIAPIFNAFSRLVETVKAGFSVAVDGIGRLWEGIKAKLRAPVQWVVDVVWNNGLRSLWNTANNLWGGDDIRAFSFARGGVMPGYTPGRDVHKFFSPTGGVLNLSGGEAVMRPEFTRALGIPTINHLNEIARQSGERGLLQALGMDGGPRQSFAGGGIVNLPGWLSTAIKFLPGGGAISAIVDKVNGSVGGEGGGSFGSMVLGLAKNLGKKVVDKALDLFGGSDGGGSGTRTPNGSGGLGPAARAAHEFVRQNWGFSGTIGGYANRNIAGTNQLSKHALGKAIDVMTYANMGLGQSIADFFAGPGRGRFGVDNVIFNRRIHSGRGWGAYYGASPHTDHPHIDFYKMGTDFVPHDGPAVLHRGEAVLTAAENAARGGPLDLSDATIDRLAVAMMRGAGAVVGGALTTVADRGRYSR